MTTQTINREKRKAAKFAADVELTAILDAFSAEYQRCMTAVMAKTMTPSEMQAAVRTARSVRDAALKARN